MEVKVYINRFDLIKFNLVVLPRIKANWVTFAILTTVIFLFLLYLEDPCDRKGVIPNLLVAIAGAVGGFLGLLALTFIGIASMNSEGDGLLGEHIYRLLPEGLYEETSANETLQKWEGISSIESVGGYYLFQINSYLFHIIPMRCFASETKAKEFLDEAKRLKSDI